MSYVPCYLESYKNGRLKSVTDGALDALSVCELCPRNCRIDRFQTNDGFCRTGRHSVVASFNPHFGEEKPLVGQKGSGTIFFANCNLGCNFCQNYDVSHYFSGEEYKPVDLANIMIYLQNSGCHNINFVTPSHVVPQILEALDPAIELGLNIPLIYNSSAYDSLETLKLLDGIIDIYMPDFKFWHDDIARESCDASDYPQIARQALLEMHRQVGDLVLDENGMAVRGLLIRHLVLPAEKAGTLDIMKFIANELSTESYINIMAQFRPLGDQAAQSLLNRNITQKEFEAAIKIAKDAGLHRLD